VGGPASKSLGFCVAIKQFSNYYFRTHPFPHFLLTAVISFYIQSEAGYRQRPKPIRPFYHLLPSPQSLFYFFPFHFFYFSGYLTEHQVEIVMGFETLSRGLPKNLTRYVIWCIFWRHVCGFPFFISNILSALETRSPAVAVIADRQFREVLASKISSLPCYNTSSQIQIYSSTLKPSGLCDAS